MYTLKEDNINILVDDKLDNSSIKIYFHHGARDDEVTGISHFYEHLLIDYLSKKYKNFLDKIDGSANRDLININMVIDNDHIHYVLDNLISKEDFIFPIHEDTYNNNINLIEQELSIYRNRPETRLQQIIYATIAGNSTLSKPLYNDTPPTIKDIEQFLEQVKDLNITFVVSCDLFSYLKSKYLFLSLDKISSMKFNIQNENKNSNLNNNVYNVVDSIVGSDQVSIAIKSGLIRFNDLHDYIDLYTVRLATNIINERIKNIRNLGAYFSLCFPAYHRKEISISIIFSSKINGENKILDLIDVLTTKPFEENEIKKQSDESENTDIKNQIREQMAVMYGNNDILLKREPEQLRLENIHLIQKLINDRLNNTIIITSKEKGN